MDSTAHESQPHVPHLSAVGNWTVGVLGLHSPIELVALAHAFTMQKLPFGWKAGIIEKVLLA